MLWSLYPRSLPAATYEPVILLPWWHGVESVFQRLRELCATFSLTALLALLLACSVAPGRFDLFLLATFLFTLRILFRPQQLPCAASTVNPTTGPVPESPSDVESSSNSSTNPEGGLPAVLGVAAGNLAARESCSPLHINYQV